MGLMKAYLLEQEDARTKAEEAQGKSELDDLFYERVDDES